MKGIGEPSRSAGGKEEGDIIRRLGEEAGLTAEEAAMYLKLLRDGSVPVSLKPELTRRLVDRGLAIISGDEKRVKPIHPRLGIASHYRTWRERMVREINEKRMRTDKLILELIPVYEAAMEKRTGGGGNQGYDG